MSTNEEHSWFRGTEEALTIYICNKLQSKISVKWFSVVASAINHFVVSSVEFIAHEIPPCLHSLHILAAGQIKPKKLDTNVGVCFKSKRVLHLHAPR